MSTLNDWIDHVCSTLELEQLTARERDIVLDLTRDVAHGVARPGAPVTAFLLGLAVGQGRPLVETAALLSGEAGTWPAGRPAAAD